MNKKLDKRNPELDLTAGIFGKWSFVNRNYEAIKAVSLMSSTKKWINIKMFIKQKLAMFGLVVFLLLLLLALIMPTFLSDPHIVNPSDAHANVFSGNHYLGTDYLGRDIWTRLWYGLRFSIGMAAVAVVIDLFIGFIFGALMGFFPKFDVIGQFIIKIFTNIPSTIILILLAIVLEPSFWTIVLGLTVTGWIGMANQVRGYVVRTKNQDWVVASKTLGSSNLWVLFKKMTPHLIPIVTAQLIFTISGALIGDLSLSVLGLSIPNTATLGSLLEAGQKFILVFPMEALLPVIAITITLSSIQFIGFGLQNVAKKA